VLLKVTKMIVELLVSNCRQDMLIASAGVKELCVSFQTTECINARYFLEPLSAGRWLIPAESVLQERLMP
jgi:hypothetical protein